MVKPRRRKSISGNSGKSNDKVATGTDSSEDITSGQSSRTNSRMSTGSSGVDQPNSSITSSLRKRHSPNSGNSSSGIRRDVVDPAGGSSSGAASSSSAVHSAAPTKQRRIAPTLPNKVTTEETGDSSVGRELRYLTDFFPDQVDGGRLTRSKAKGPSSPVVDQPASPALNISSNDNDDDTHNVGGMSPECSSRSKKTARKGGRSAGSFRNAAAHSDAGAGPSSSSPSSSSTTLPTDAPPAQHQQGSHMSQDALFAELDAHAAHFGMHGMSMTLASHHQHPAGSTGVPMMGRVDPRMGMFPPSWDTLGMTMGDMPSSSNNMQQAAAAAAVAHDHAHQNAVHTSAAAHFMIGGALPQYMPHHHHVGGVNQIPVIQHQQAAHSSSSPLSSSSSAGGPPPVPLGMLFDPITPTSVAAAAAAAGVGGAPNPNNQARSISRSAASQFIHGLVPRMQHLLGGHKAVPQDSRVTGIMEGLRSVNELRQAEAAGELAEWLLMANEDNLPSHLPIRDITHALIQLLQKEHNFELMLTAARCLRNLLEAVPRAQPIVVDAVPYLLEKLKRIECVDVAEQSLTALEELSKRNSKTILASGGIAACISHVDFFSLSSQRLAFSIASNCAIYLSSSDFPLVRDSLSDLTERLLIEDKRCLESVCQLFARLVENLRNHPDKLLEIAGLNYRLLALVQQLLVAQPSQLNSTTFSSVVRMLRTLASKCPELATALIRMDYQSTLRCLFTGSGDNDNNEIMERPPNQLQDMVYLVGELFPRLPTTGIFEIDSVFTKQVSVPDATWLWQDDDQQWQAFRAQEGRMLELAKSNEQPFYEIVIGNHMYRMDMAKMVQRNLSTGTERPIQRRANSPGKSARGEPEDGRLTMHEIEPQLMEKVVSTLFPVMVAIDASSSGPALRYECLRVMLRMLCPVPALVLRNVLSDLPLSGHIASALASPRSKDLTIVVAALQMVHLLLEKLSDVYAPLFRKEGVAHEVQKLAAVHFETKSAPVSGTASPATQSEPTGRVTRSHRARTSAGDKEELSRSSRSKKEKTAASSDPSPSTESTTTPTKESRHRKRASPDGSPAVKKEKESRRKSSGLLNALRIPGMGGSGSSTRPSSTSTSPSASANATPPSSASAHQTMGSFIAQMVAQSSSASTSAASAAANAAARSRAAYGGVGIAGGSSSLTSGTKEKLRAWIRKEAEALLKTYLSESGTDGSVIDCLSWVAEQLRIISNDVGTTPLTQLHDILKTDTVSAFEMTHSGVISALHNYLVSEDESIQPPRKLRLKRFAAVFMHLTADNLRPSGEDGCFAVFEALVSKTLASVAQLEQFQVKVNDMGGIATGSSGCLRGAQALRFFQSHQIKCCLRRHPNCRDLKDYHRHGGSTIKVDPFTSISAIEKYLLDKGIGRVKAAGEESSGDDISDDDETLIHAPAAGEERRIEIMMGEQALPSTMSVLQALRQYGNTTTQGEDATVGGSSLWMTTHTLYYRSAAEVAPTAASSEQPTTTPDKKKHKVPAKHLADGGEIDMKSPLWVFLDSQLPRPIDDPCVPSLLLLRALHGLNRYWFGLFDEEVVLPTTYAPLLPATSFFSSKLAAKLQRQLTDFISVATQQIPAWTVDLGNAVPFLFTFSLRRSLLYCTSFGRDRALMHLVSQTEGVQGEGETGRLTPRLERRKIVVQRDNLMKSAETALAANASARAMLEVSFENEAGTGFGPTLEFYSTVSRELQDAKHQMWHGASQKEETEDGKSIEYMVPGYGLFPEAHHSNSRKDAARIKKFETLGRLMGQALVDCRMLDLPMSPVVLHWLTAEPDHMGIAQLEVLDPDMYRSMRQITLCEEEDFEGLMQYFTLPGNESFELVKGGKNQAVTKENVGKFVKLVTWWRLVNGVQREMEALKKGFAQVVDPTQLSLFLPEELDQLFCGCSDGGEKVWGDHVIAQAIKPDHGYTHDSDQIRWLVRMLSSFDRDDQRRFVQFVTGSPRLPVGGFRALNPPLTVVRKTAAYGSGDEELPSAMTCYNYLKVPAYSSYEVFRERFAVALQFIYSFHLT